jgi:hypothetical protein
MLQFAMLAASAEDITNIAVSKIGFIFNWLRCAVCTIH